MTLYRRCKGENMDTSGSSRGLFDRLARVMDIDMEILMGGVPCARYVIWQAWRSVLREKCDGTGRHGNSEGHGYSRLLSACSAHR